LLMKKCFMHLSLKSNKFRWKKSISAEGLSSGRKRNLIDLSLFIFHVSLFR